MVLPFFDDLGNQHTADPVKMERNHSTAIDPGESMTNDDGAWIMLNAFLILTMQSGFALLESGCVMHKNIANIMVKNTVDITVGGLSYFMCGYALSLGKPSNAFVGYGDFFLIRDLTQGRGSFYATYTFQFSFATTATTIVSGAIAERMTFNSYVVFSFINPILYALPCCWVWNSTGFLYKLGVIDFAGALVVHFTGGVTALVGTVMLGPRLGRFSVEGRDRYKQNSPVTALTGTFMLWWAWLSFNAGSTFGMRGGLWKQAALSAINTMQGSIGGGVAGLFLAYKLSGGYFEIPFLINSILGGLVSVTGVCGVSNPLNSLIIGAIGAIIAILASYLLERLRIDDPAGVIPVHLFAATWGVIAVGLFSDPESLLESKSVYNGLFYGGGGYLLMVQLASLLIIAVWTAATSAVLFIILHKTVGFRMTVEDEMIGADWVEHRVKSESSAVILQRALESIEWEQSADELDVVIGKIFKELMKPRQDTIPKVVNFNPDPMDGRGTRQQMKDRGHMIESHMGSIAGSATESRVSTPGIPECMASTSHHQGVGMYSIFRRHNHNTIHPIEVIEEECSNL